MNKQEIIDIGIIFACVTAIFSGYVLGLIFYPLAIVFLCMAFLFLIISRGIHECYKEKLPWRKNKEEHHE